MTEHEQPERQGGEAERERALSDARNTGYHGDPLITHTRSAAAPQTGGDAGIRKCHAPCSPGVFAEAKWVMRPFPYLEIAVAGFESFAVIPADWGIDQLRSALHAASFHHGPARTIIDTYDAGQKPSLQPAGEENLRAVVAEFRAEAVPHLVTTPWGRDALKKLDAALAGTSVQMAECEANQPANAELVNSVASILRHKFRMLRNHGFLETEESMAMARAAIAAVGVKL